LFRRILKRKFDIPKSEEKTTYSDVKYIVYYPAQKRVELYKRYAIPIAYIENITEIKQGYKTPELIIIDITAKSDFLSLNLKYPIEVTVITFSNGEKVVFLSEY